MGKRIRAQRIGRGSSVYISPKLHKLGDIQLPTWPESYSDVIKGTVLEIKHESGRTAPLALVKFVKPNGEIKKIWMIANEGIYTGKEIQVGPLAKLDIGNVLPLGKIPEGIPVSNIEITPGDGGKIARAAGMYAIIRSHDRAAGKTEIELPGKRRITLNSKCRAQIGIIAGAGMEELPLVKAGNAYYKWKVRGRKWPRTRGVAMKGSRLLPKIIGVIERIPSMLLITPLVADVIRNQESLRLYLGMLRQEEKLAPLQQREQENVRSKNILSFAS